MRPQEEIDRRGLQQGECLHVVAGDLWIAPVVHENVACVHVRAADDDGVQRAATLCHLHHPGRAAGGVPRREPRRECRAAELDCVSVVQDAIDFRAWPSRRCALDRGHVGVHHHQPRAGVGLDETDTLVVIAMRMADQEDFRVGVLEAEALDALADCRHILLEVAVDQDVALRCRDEIRGEVRRPDVVEVAGNLEARDGSMPIGIRLRTCRDRKQHD